MHPKSLQEAIQLFSDKLVCHNYMVSKRWPNGVACPHCGSVEVGFVQTRLIWNCKGCKKQFSVKIGTVLEESPLSLSTWLPAFWLIANCKNGISSCELARALDVTQKTAWFMLHRIRVVMEQGTFEKLTSTVEVAATYIGGKAGNKHAKKRNTKSGVADKTIVHAFIQRGESESHSTARATIVPDTFGPTMKASVRAHVDKGAYLISDSAGHYRGLSAEYRHEVANHAYEYVRDHVHTNSMENFFSLLKRTIKGTYGACSPEHLPAYLSEQTFRFNHRKDNDGGRFETTMGNMNSKRLTYKKLIGK